MSNSKASNTEDFAEDILPPGQASRIDHLVLNLDGFDGPIDLLLAMARDQKVDLTKISILALAEQYLMFIERARQLRLELAADYLVMAAWLAYLKSKLLLPAPVAEAGEENPAELAARLAFQLQRLEAMQTVTKTLFNCPRLGQDFFGRGMPEQLKISRKAVYEANLLDLLKVYGELRRKQEGSGQLRIMPTRLISMEQAARRLRAILGDMPDWQILEHFIPDESEDPLVYRSAMASTFAASLELSKEGLVDIRQTNIFGTIYMRARPGADLSPDVQDNLDIRHDLYEDEDPLDPEDTDLFDGEDDTGSGAGNRDG